eukprot:9500049-Pyramimonas_sp.AAC.1
MRSSSCASPRALWGCPDRHGRPSETRAWSPDARARPRRLWLHVGAALRRSGASFGGLASLGRVHYSFGEDHRGASSFTWRRNHARNRKKHREWTSERWPGGLGGAHPRHAGRQCRIRRKDWQAAHQVSLLHRGPSGARPSNQIRRH